MTVKVSGIKYILPTKLPQVLILYVITENNLIIWNNITERDLLTLRWFGLYGHVVASDVFRGSHLLLTCH